MDQGMNKKTAQIPMPRSKRTVAPATQTNVGVPQPRNRRTVTPVSYTQETGMPVALPTGNSSFEAVKQMQEAILNFGKVLAAHPVMSMKDDGQQVRQRKEGEDYLGGSAPFGNFLTNEYVNNAEVVGKQFVNIDLQEPLRSGTAHPNVNLKGVINTISRVGTPGTEHKVDGVWQTRTNNALKQIYAVVASLIHFAKDMDINIAGVTEKDVEEFRNNIPVSYLNLKNENVAEKATFLTKYINMFTRLYQVFEKSVLENSEMKSLINQDKSFVDHSNLSKTSLVPEEQQFYDNHKDTIIPGVAINNQSVRLMDIVSDTAFKKFLQSAHVDISKPEEVQKNLQMIKAHLSGADEGPGF